MLTDIQLRRLKPQEKIYKVTDRDGLYVAVSPTGTRSFRYDYRINGRRETLTFGQYGADGISLAEAREQLIAAKKLIKSGVSPAVDKRYGKNKLRESETLTVYTDNYMKHVTLADSTRAMKEAVIERDILPVLGNKLMTEITTAMVRASGR
ncbi:integrase arm-type DNA-binding domain-containing protein [Salmonella enterica]|nr:integrase arm-type DNA-binding domain-containing protein [Salmonella enterica]EJI6517827.1 integrase arm-type DNA-binding domain-containing protein [Salmonella enterica]EJI6778376.1 integrase arm-type DNA-binding domain-containing protein [Salmonella enterica]EJK2460193.1 integrase arm-type DNA-binding domain-containing protein [Salmonella enterica]EKS4564719.1 integrase arm-type DNA-binding domain-containing protein [Salmonella enterica]